MTEHVMWRFVAASAVGTSHAKANLPCQDRFACEALPEGGLLAALADGAGSAVFAERGAEIAVDSVIAHLARGLREERSDFDQLLREAASIAREAIAADAERQRSPLRDYASTLLAVVLTPDGGGALQVGDGVIVVNDGGDGWNWVFWPQRGEYVNTTNFLTDPDAVCRMEVDVFTRPLSDVALMSDGAEPLALEFSSETVHDPFFNGMFAPVIKAEGCGNITSISKSLEKFLASERVGSRTDDDVTLILATRREREPTT